jgi:hypothetical protein
LGIGLGAENKSASGGVFFGSEKVTVKTPRQPRIPPQLHHVFTTTKHVKITKYSCKITTSSCQIFFCQKP